jgi:hypothetical protein
MAKPKSSSDALDNADGDVKTISKSGPAGFLLIAIIVLMIAAIAVLSVLLLGSGGEPGFRADRKSAAGN